MAEAFDCDLIADFDVFMLAAPWGLWLISPIERRSKAQSCMLLAKRVSEANSKTGRSASSHVPDIPGQMLIQHEFHQQNH